MHLRTAEPPDALAVARVHVRSWQAAYRGLIADAYLDQLHPEDRAQRYDFSHTDASRPHTIVAVDAGTIVGFATTAPSRDPALSGHGELCALYVDPNQWSKGFGVALVAAARARLFQTGFREAFLWVLVGNTRADRFYRNDGWSPAGERRSETLWGITLDEARYRRILTSQSTVRVH